MEKQYQILDYLQDDEYTSQRKIAEGTGLSLGTVNILLKRMIKKGLIKTERLDARSLRYIVTPKGLAQKMKLTYNYVKRSYKHIMRVIDVVEEIVRESEKHGFSALYLYGAKNEVSEIVQLALRELDVDFSFLNNAQPPPLDSSLIIVWEENDEANLSINHQVVNILKVI